VLGALFGPKPPRGDGTGHSYLSAEIAVFVLNLSEVIFLRTAPHTLFHDTDN